MTEATGVEDTENDDSPMVSSGPTATADGEEPELAKPMEAVLEALESAFPEFYSPITEVAEPEPEPERADAEPETSAAPPSKSKKQAPASAKKKSVGKTGGSAKGRGSADEQQTAEPAEPQPEEPAPYDPYQEKIASIDDRFNSARSEAEVLERYLLSADRDAKASELRAMLEADEEFTPKWRHCGLPMVPSHLVLDRSRLQGSCLVDATKIMQDHQDLVRKEVLNPPAVFSYNDKTADPHYYATTATVENRLKLFPDRIEKARARSSRNPLRTWHKKSEEEVQELVGKSEARRKALSQQMPGVQKDANEKIIKAMKHKLGFLRNPRHLPMAAEKVPTSGPGRVPPIKANLTAEPGRAFVLEPREVHFQDYAAGQVYQQLVKLRNVSNVGRHVRLLPPSSQYFFVSQLSHPDGHGFVAPGMYAEFKISFCPDSLADFSDTMAVDTEPDRFTLDLKASRTPPALTLPDGLAVGEVIVGNCNRRSFSFCNLGGPGDFRIIPAEFWPDRNPPSPGVFNKANTMTQLISCCSEEAAPRMSEAPEDTASIGPFTLSPMAFSMPQGAESELHVSFQPADFGAVQKQLYLVCNNCNVKPMALSGSGIGVSVVLEELDGRRVEPGELEKPVWFSEVFLGARHTREVKVANNTSVALPFRWRQSERSCQEASAAEHRAADEASRHIPLDVVQLGLVPHSAFDIMPAKGQLAAGEVVKFHICFAPTQPTRYERWAQLLVDKALPGTQGSRPDTMVAELGMEGWGVPLQLDVSPPIVRLPGQLMVGQSVAVPLTVFNGCNTEAAFSFAPVQKSWEEASVDMEEAAGKVPAGSSKVVQVLVRGRRVGPTQCQLLCTVQDGLPVQPICISADVTGPRIQMKGPNLDLGMARLHERKMGTLQLSNPVDDEFLSFSLSEVRPDDGAAAGQPGRAPNRCWLEFRPDSGTIGPGKTCAAEVWCTAAEAGEFRSLIQCSTKNGDETFLPVRCDVVAPRIALSHNRLDLGCTFLGVPLSRRVTVRNLTKMFVEFAFGESMGRDPDHLSINLSQKEGRLEAGSCQEVEICFTPTVLGAAEMLIPCKVLGDDAPVGILVTATVCGLEVEYAILTEQDVMAGKPEGKLPAATQGGGSRGRRRGPVVDCLGFSHRVDFGDDVGLGDTRHRYLRVRNLTAMTAQVSVWVDTFMARDLESLTAGTRSLRRLSSERQTQLQSGPSAGKRAATLKLGCAHEKLSPFQSELGNAMMASRRLQAQAQELLGPKGLAISLQPGSGTLLPNSELLMKITCVNNMCGTYLDMLHCQVGELPTLHVPLRVGVKGSPLQVQRERVMIPGLQTSGRSRMALDFGMVPASIVCTRTFYVWNSSCFDLRLSWNNFLLPTLDDPDRKFVDMHLKWGRPGGRVRVHLEPVMWPAPPDGAFQVTPVDAMVKSGQSAGFTVTFRSEVARHYMGRLVSHQQICSELEGIRPQIRSVLDPADPERIRLVLVGEFHANAAAPPAPLAPLTVDLCGRSIRCHLEPEELSQVDLVCHANLPPSSHPSYSRTVTFSNLQKCPQSFTMAIESDRAEDAAAFRLVSAVPSVPQDPDVFRGCMCLPESRSEQGAKVFEPGTLFLPPRESVDVTVQFVPSKQRLQGRQDYSVAAALVLRYNNCDVQHLPVQASVLHPELKASVEVLDFGQAHPQAPKYLEIEISNHSQADAEWKIAAPGANDSGTGGKKPAALLIRDSSGLASTAEPTPSLAAAKTRPAAVPQKEGTAEEDPFEATSAARLVAAAPDLAQAVGCFVVSPRQGLLHGMGNTLPATQRIRITFCPPANAAYRRELVFSAKRGRSCKVVLTGRGSYDETVEFKANLMSL